MSKPRLPTAVATATGAVAKNAGRFAGRAKGGGLAELGPPSKHLAKFEVQAFELFRAELPWLKESDRLLVELASQLRGRVLDPADVLPFQGFQELRRCLGAMGATPADQSKVNMGDGGEEDPDEALFGAQGKAH